MPLTVSEIFLSFKEAVEETLPRDIDCNFALNLADDKGFLASILRKTFAPEDKTYLFSVDYEREPKKAIEAGNYQWVDPRIDSKSIKDFINKEKENMPSFWKDKASLMMEFIELDVVFEKDVYNELKQMDLWPANLLELLAFGENYPDVQCDFSIFAAGSMWWWDRQNQNYLLPCLYYEIDAKRKLLGLYPITEQIKPKRRFAAVREQW